MKNIKIIALTGVAIAVFLLFGCGIKDDGYNFGDDNGVVVGDGDVQIRTEALYGIEDYYMLCMAEEAFGREWVDEQVKSVSPNVREYNDDHEQLDRVREVIGNRLSEHFSK